MHEKVYKEELEVMTKKLNKLNDLQHECIVAYAKNIRTTHIVSRFSVHLHEKLDLPPLNSDYVWEVCTEMCDCGD